MRAWILARLGARWIRAQRRRHLPSARVLSDDERASLRGYFDEELLSSVRVRQVQRVDRPWFVGPMSWLGLELDMDFRDAAGITFGDLILISGLGADRVVPSTLLFHEMVHVLQYRVLGIDGFALEYARGWLENGRAYRSIPLEREAYAQEAHYEAGERFHVRCAWDARPSRDR